MSLKQHASHSMTQYISSRCLSLVPWGHIRASVFALAADCWSSMVAIGEAALLVQAKALGITNLGIVTVAVLPFSGNVSAFMQPAL